jgi:hypothetical protein
MKTCTPQNENQLHQGVGTMTRSTTMNVRCHGIDNRPDHSDAILFKRIRNIFNELMLRKRPYPPRAPR